MIKKDQTVKITLITSKYDTKSRMMCGITESTYTGLAGNDLKVGQSFILLTVGDEIFATSPITKIMPTVFNTQNSSYSYEVLDD